MTIRTSMHTGSHKCLGDVDVLHDLPAAELWALSTLAQEHTYRKGELIEGLGREDGGVFAVLRGAVRLYLGAGDGRQITLRYRYTGEAFELQRREERGRVATLGEALMDHTVIASLPWATFVDVVLPHSGHVVDTLLRQALEEERLTFQEFAFSTTKVRLAHKLAVLAEAQPAAVVQKTRDELAAMVGTRPEEVTKLLADLRDDGLIQYQPYARAIVILQSDALAAL